MITIKISDHDTSGHFYDAQYASRLPKKTASKTVLLYLKKYIQKLQK